MKLLAYTTPALGHLFPAMPILLEMQARGHRVSVRTISSQVEQTRKLGLEVSPCSPTIEEIALDDWTRRSRPARALRSLNVFTARAPEDAADLRSAIDEVRPDAVLVDCTAWGACTVAEASGLPWATFVPFPLPIPSRELPPTGLGLRPPRTAAGRMRDATLRLTVRATIDRVILPSLNPLRATIGLQPLQRGTDLFARAPLVLNLTAEPLEYRRGDWPRSVKMVGPCSWDPPAPRPEWLDRVTRPLLLVSSSSEHQKDSRLVKTALSAFAGKPFELVATLPAHEADGIEVPANARLDRFLAHGPILKRATCAITHGGAGVTQKALAAGVPVCVVPFGRDQYEVARRVQVARAGSALPAYRLTPRALRAAVERAIGCREGAQRVSRGFAAAGGAIAAADAIEMLLPQ